MGKTGGTADEATLRTNRSEVRQLDLGLEPSDVHRLYEEVRSTRTLEAAFKKVKANQGAPGPDGESLEEFEEDLEARLNQLREELENWSYKPSPVRRVVIPKPGGGERLLGVAIRRHIAHREVYLRNHGRWCLAHTFGVAQA